MLSRENSSCSKKPEDLQQHHQEDPPESPANNVSLSYSRLAQQIDEQEEKMMESYFDEDEILTRKANKKTKSSNFEFAQNDWKQNFLKAENKNSLFGKKVESFGCENDEVFSPVFRMFPQEQNEKRNSPQKKVKQQKKPSVNQLFSQSKKKIKPEQSSKIAQSLPNYKFTSNNPFQIKQSEIKIDATAKRLCKSKVSASRQGGIFRTIRDSVELRPNLKKKQKKISERSRNSMSIQTVVNVSLRPSLSKSRQKQQTTYEKIKVLERKQTTKQSKIQFPSRKKALKISSKIKQITDIIESIGQQPIQNKKEEKIREKIQDKSESSLFTISPLNRKFKIFYKEQISSLFEEEQQNQTQNYIFNSQLFTELQICSICKSQKISQEIESFDSFQQKFSTLLQQILAISNLKITVKKIKNVMKGDIHSTNLFFLYENINKIYLGQVSKNIIMQGQGLLLNPQKSLYIGSFENNKRHGLGKYIEIDELYYQGQWANDKMQGKGVLKDSNGLIYEGEFQKNLKQGKGIESFPNQDSYQGEYKNNCYNGTGLYMWSNGSFYEGEFRNGKMEGEGRWISHNGDIYEGQYSNNLKHGNGVYKWPNGQAFKGQFQNGKKIKSYF